MYERFLNCHNLPSGAVLGHVLKHASISQRELAEMTGILPQRINDFINGRRRITAEASLKLERALAIRIEGFFYILQSNHDIYVAVGNDSDRKIPDLSKIRKSIFWDTDFGALDWSGNRVAIVRRVFEYGDENAIREIIRFYGESEVREILKSITDIRMSDRRSENMSKYLT